ncbi:MerR family transcriptional regulator [bacterium]|nr:MAG: MerR family transcriptional regulator [bacterium]RKZ25014.1 MAG: MerR family transcriptional regulator [bacterium]
MEKLYYTIKEVSEITGLPPSTLRYWEKVFPELRPVRTSKGRRRYRKKDIEMVEKIKNLLHNQGYTIEGARKKLKKKTLIEEIIKELEEIKKILGG